MIQIDKGIEMPKLRSYYRYPFQQMEVGDSFFSPKVASIKTLSSLFGRKTGKKFTYRSATENGVKGCRCWRIA